MAVRIHPREQNTNLIQSKLVLAIYEAVEAAEKELDFELTDGEVVRVFSGAFHEILGTWAKYKIRDERHGDANKPGGQA